MNSDLTWGLQHIGVAVLWDAGLRGQGVRIGHLDTGIEATHPVLAGRLADFLAFDRFGYPDSDTEPFDETGHGTHIASILCGGVQDGVAHGVAAEARLFSGAVIESGHTTIRIVRGLVWLLEQRTDVICLAFGFTAGNPIYAPLLRAAQGANIPVVCPIGNGGAGYCLSPGDSPLVISVGAVDEQGHVPRFSGSMVDGWGRIVKPDVLAPGVNIPLVERDTDSVTTTTRGTSAACAYVAGGVALLRQAVPYATPTAIKAALMQTASPVHQQDERRSVAGCVNLPAALSWLRDHPHLPAPEEPAVAACQVDPKFQQDLRYTSKHTHIRAVVHLAPGKLAMLQQEHGDSLRIIASFLDGQLVVMDVASEVTARWIASLERGVLAIGSPKTARLM